MTVQTTFYAFDGVGVPNAFIDGATLTLKVGNAQSDALIEAGDLSGNIVVWGNARTTGPGQGAVQLNGGLTVLGNLVVNGNIMVNNFPDTSYSSVAGIAVGDMFVGYTTSARNFGQNVVVPTVTISVPGAGTFGPANNAPNGTYKCLGTRDVAGTGPGLFQRIA